MTKNAVIIHGMPSEAEYYSPDIPSPSNFQWIPWLRNKLSAEGVETETPEMPRPYAPEYQAWKHEFERCTVNQETILVGHSCGGGFLLRWIAEAEQSVGDVFLVAPWLDPDKELSNGFFDFSYDNTLMERVNSLTVFVSDDDTPDILESARSIKNKLPNARFIECKGKGHFVGEDFIQNGFPELLEEILN